MEQLIKDFFIEIGAYRSVTGVGFIYGTCLTRKLLELYIRQTTQRLESSINRWQTFAYLSMKNPPQEVRSTAPC